jgi:hypothetical protein
MRTLNIFAQRVVDQRLVVAAPGGVDDFLEVLDQIVIESNRYSSFSPCGWDNWTTPGFAKIVLSFHFRSDACACLYTGFGGLSICNLARNSAEELKHHFLESPIGRRRQVVAAFEHYQPRSRDHRRQRPRISDRIVVGADDDQHRQPHRR